MRQLAGSLFSLGLGLSAFCHVVTADTQPTAPEAVVFRTASLNGEQHFAVAIRSSLVPAELKRHIILIDTSASQTGRFRDQSIELLSSVIDRLPAGHTVMVAAADSSVDQLTPGFVSAGSAELKQSVEVLSARTPMGATDISESLREAIGSDASLPLSMLYIGDGMSAADQLSLTDLSGLVDHLRSQQVSFHAFLLGPKVDSELTSILANQTGGTVQFPQSSNPDSSAVTLVSAISAAPVMMSDLTAAESGATLAADDVVALRADRETILFGKGSPSSGLKVSGRDAAGVTQTWSATVSTVRPSGEEVRILFDRANQTQGLNNSIVGIEGLDAAARRFTVAVDQSIDVARKLHEQGENEKAMTVARQGLRLDGSNVILTSLVSTLQDESSTGTANDKLGPPAVGDGDPLRRSEAKNEIVTQQLVMSTNAAIAEARRVASEQPEYAITLLKDLLDTIRSADELAPEKRDELERRISAAYSSVQAERQSVGIRQREESERRAAREYQENMLNSVDLEEERLRTLISQVRGLLERARHGDVYAFEQAEEVSRIAIDMKPGNGTASAALVMSEASGQLSKAYRLINLRHDRFLETLYQVELSHVPFPDEPPIIYPPADVWRALTIARKKKYKSVALRSEKPVEMWLDEQLDLPIPDLEYPGEESLEVILQYISDYYTDLGPYTMRILPDVSDPDIETIDYLASVNVTNVNLKGITLRNALKLIFARVKDQELTFMIKNEVMLITTVATAESEENLVTRIYDVADLVIPIIVQQGGGQQGGGQGGGFGGGGQQGGGGGGFGGGGQQGGGGGGGVFSLPAEDLQAPADGIRMNGSDAVKKKPAR